MNIGQLIFTGISGLSLTDEEKSFIEENDLGGVILFAHNYESPAQLAELCNEIQNLRQKYPLFIGVDQEGGRVIRFKEPFYKAPPMYEVGKTASPKLCFDLSQVIASQLVGCGVNTNFAPCCDIWSNKSNKVIGDRSFGHEPEIVSKMVSAIIRGFQTNNLISCAKHFPGHGDTTKDSHFDLPIVKNDLETLEKREIEPFVKAVKSRVEMIMIAHLVVDAFDEKLPTSLSPKVYNYLRKELRYKGILITDDMEMKAIADNYTVEQASVNAIKAGADMVIYRSFDSAKLAFEGISQALKDNIIKKPVALDKIKRIEDCKKKYLSEFSPIQIPELQSLFNSELETQLKNAFGQTS